MKTRTSEIGTRTGRLTRTSVAGKDPNFDYCFKTRREIDEGLAEQEGWSVVKGRRDESWQNPFAAKEESKTKGTGQMALMDTLLCKRSKEATAYYHEHNHVQKRNAQKRLIREARGLAQKQLRNGDPDAKVTGGVFTQKAGKNMEADHG